MSVILGSGEYTYRVVEGWEKLPPGWEFGDVAAVAVDKKDRVYVFNRGAHPMCVFDRDGNFLSSWGENIFKRAHGLHIGPDEALYCTDDGDHTVRKCTLEGKVVLELGISNRPAAYMSGVPFNRCTHTALSPEGDIYVSDGYGNARIHKFSASGKQMFSWGESGCQPGQFNCPHNICCDADGWVYVADRENHRIQIFDRQGKFETQWHNVHRPSGLYMQPGRCPICYIGEIGPYMSFSLEAPNLGPRISIADHKGNILARLGKDPTMGVKPGQFVSPHGMTVDSQGSLYVGEVGVTAWPAMFPDKPMPRPLRTLQKFEKVAPRS